MTGLARKATYCFIGRLNALLGCPVLPNVHEVHSGGASNAELGVDQGIRCTPPIEIFPKPLGKALVISERLVAEIDAREHTHTVATRLRSLTQTRTSLEKESENLTKLRIRDLITDEEYLKQRQELERHQIKIAQSLKTAEEPDLRFEPARLLISFSKRAVSWFQAGDARIKRLILTIAGSNPQLKDKKLCIDARKPFVRGFSLENFPLG